MVYISKVYTRFGDQGNTMLASGDTVAKDSPRVRAFGDVDELNAFVGALRLAVLEEQHNSSRADFVASVEAALCRIQQELFNLGSELATNGDIPDSRPRIEQRHVDRLEAEIDELNDSLEPLRSFILPGGGKASVQAHLARTVCRRAERNVVELAREHELRSESRIYLNRLSDYFFVLGRVCAQAFGHDETLWETEKT